MKRFTGNPVCGTSWLPTHNLAMGRLVLFVAAAILFTGCASVTSPEPGAFPRPSLPAPNGGYVGGTVPAVLEADGRFTTLLAILEQTETTSGPPGSETTERVVDLMQLPDLNHTIFAPTDDAFGELSDASFAQLVEDADARLTMVRAIITQRLWRSHEFVQGQIQTVRGPMEVLVDDGTVRIGGVLLVEMDIAADNGIIHVTTDGIISFNGS
jgi:hypothetical protein